MYIIKGVWYMDVGPNLKLSGLVNIISDTERRFGFFQKPVCAKTGGIRR